MEVAEIAEEVVTAVIGGAIVVVEDLHLGTDTEMIEGLEDQQVL